METRALGIRITAILINNTNETHHRDATRHREATLHREADINNTVENPRAVCTLQSGRKFTIDYEFCSTSKLAKFKLCMLLDFYDHLKDCLINKCLEI